MSDDPAAFLAARLDETEAGADEVHLPRHCGCIDRDAEFRADPVFCCCGGPDRVRRGVAAMRAILAEHAPDEGSAWCGTGEEWLSAGCPTLSLLIAIWSDHPDYRPGWAVSCRP
jgi:hypothetical protein